MKQLKEEALTRPQGFYKMSNFGAPVILFGFLIGSLHNLYEDFGIDRKDFDPGSKADDELLDWWDVLYWLKQGLADSAIRSNEHSAISRETMADLYGPEVDSIQTAADFEFQWLLCRTYSNQTLTMAEAWQLVKEGQKEQSVSNEYTGENLLHILIVQNHSPELNLAWHLDVLFDKFVTRPQFRNILMGEKVLLSLAECLLVFCNFFPIGNWAFFLSRSRRSHGFGADAVALCCSSRLCCCCQMFAKTLPGRSDSAQAAVGTR